MPTLTPDYSTWLTKDETAAALNISTKQVERYAKAGKLQQERWQRPKGGQHFAVYAPADVERLTHELYPSRPFVAPPATPSKPDHGLQRRAPERPADASAAMQAFVRLVEHVSTQAQTSQTVYLTLDDAARFTGLTRAYLLRRCQAHTLPAVKDGGWKIRRAVLLTLQEGETEGAVAAVAARARHAG